MQEMFSVRSARALPPLAMSLARRLPPPGTLHLAAHSMPSFRQFATAFNETLNFDTSSVMHKTPSYVSIDESSPTFLGAGSDARLLTAVSAKLGGKAIVGAGAPPVAAVAKRQIGVPYSATSALWIVCMRDPTWLKAVQLRVTSSGGNLYALAVKGGHQGANSISLDDCGTWPLDNPSNVVGSSTVHGYGVASLSYVITPSYVSFDTSSVTNMHGMFRVRSSLLCCPAPNLQPRALPCGPFASLSPATSRLPVRTSPAPYALVLSLGSTRRRSTSR